MGSKHSAEKKSVTATDILGEYVKDGHALEIVQQHINGTTTISLHSVGMANVCVDVASLVPMRLEDKMVSECRNQAKRLISELNPTMEKFIDEWILCDGSSYRLHAIAFAEEGHEYGWMMFNFKDIWTKFKSTLPIGSPIQSISSFSDFWKRYTRHNDKYELYQRKRVLFSGYCVCLIWKKDINIRVLENILEKQYEVEAEEAFYSRGYWSFDGKTWM